LNLIRNIEDTITKTDPETGKNQLLATYKEIEQEYGFNEPKISRRLENLNIDGLNDYNLEFHNTKEFLLAHDEVMGRLLQLLYDYYPDIAKKYLDRYKEFNQPLYRKMKKADMKPPALRTLAYYYYYLIAAKTLPHFNSVGKIKEIKKIAEDWGVSWKNFQKHYNKIDNDSSERGKPNHHKHLLDATKMLVEYPEALEMAKDELKLMEQNL